MVDRRPFPQRRLFVSWSYRALGIAGVLLGLGGASVLLTTPGTNWWIACIVGAGGAAFACGSWQCYVVPRLELTEAVARVWNPSGLVEIPLPCVDHVLADRTVHLVLTDGSEVSVWSVQRANLSGVLATASHVDRVAAEVASWSTSHQTVGETCTGSGGVRRQGPPLGRYAFLTAVGAAGAGLVWGVATALLQW
jgi:hypothetical protein